MTKKLIKNSENNLPPPTPEKLTWHLGLSLFKNRVFKIRTTKGWGTGFLISNYDNGDLCAIATAYHVINVAHDWGEPIKLIHEGTGKEIYLKKEEDRAILLYPTKDLAVILFKLPNDLDLPQEPIEYVSAQNYLVPGVEVGWCGFPNVRDDKLCFFHGYVSCYLDQEGDYLIDGVAIHGVSGGPVFYIDNFTNKLTVAGVITQYIANRATGESLPGVSMITSIAPCEETIKNLKNLSEAKKEEKEQKTTEIKTLDEGN